ncbi:MAG: autotransporter-associated beta strand repeat-containing protein [Opitutales bacterium]|nr:autotransporter-associated beta strand repeat-containing protein [Opitutales bacterium]
MKSKKLLFSTLFAAAAMSASALGANSLTWNGGATGNWDYASENWLNGSAAAKFASGDNATLSMAGSTLTLGTSVTAGTVTVSANTTVETGSYDLNAASIVVEDNNTLTLSGAGTYKLSGELTIKGAAANIVINSNMTLNEIATRNANATTRSLTIGSGATVNATSFSNAWGLKTLTVDGTLNISGAMSMAANNMTHTMTGSGTINVGSITVGNVGTYLFDGGLTIGLGSGGIAQSKAQPVQFANATLKATATSTSSATNIQFGSNATFNTNGNNMTFAEKLSSMSSQTSGSLVKSGAGTLTLSKGATFGGKMFAVNAGTLTLDGDTELKGLTVASGATLNVNSSTLKLGSGGIKGDSISVSLNNVTISTSDPSSTITTPIAISGTSGLKLSLSGTLTASGVISGSGALTKEGSGALLLSGENTFTGNATISAGSVIAQSATALGKGNVTIAAGAKVTADVAQTFSGNLNNAGILTLSGGLTISGTFTNTGTLNLGGSTTLPAATLGGTIVLAESATVNNLKLSNGKLSLSGTNTLTDATLTNVAVTIGASAYGAAATTIDGAITFSSGSINLSGIPFYGSDLSRVIFKADADTNLSAILSALNSGTIATILSSGADGLWTYSDNNLIFTATSASFIAWSSGTSTGSSGIWTATNFNGQQVGGTAAAGSALYLDNVSGQSAVTVNVSGEVYASVLNVVAADTVYTLAGTTGSVNVSGALTLLDSTLNVNTKLAAESIEIGTGSTLFAAVKSSLNTPSISLAATGELVLDNASAMYEGDTAKNTVISMAGGSKISFVQGALSGASKINISNASSASYAAIFSLEANQAPNKTESKYQLGDRLAFEAGSYITFDVGSNSWFDLTGATISETGVFTKTGAGTLVLTSQGTLNGSLRIDAGTVALGAAGTGSPVFDGSITVGEDGTLALIRSDSFSSNSQTATIDVYGNVYIGQDEVYDGAGTDVPTQLVDGLVFNLYGGSITGVDTSDFYLIDAKSMTINAKTGYTSEIGAMLVKLQNANAATFNVESGAVLRAGTTFIEADTESYGFTKSGAGTMLLVGTQNNNIAQYRDFTGKVTVSGGVLEVQGNFGRPSEIELAAGTELVFNLSDNTSKELQSAITGAGAVTVKSGTVSTTGAFNATGTLTVDAGAAFLSTSTTGEINQTVVLGGTVAAATLSGTLQLQDGATIGNAGLATNLSATIVTTNSNDLTIANGARVEVVAGASAGAALDITVLDGATFLDAGILNVGGATLYGNSMFSAVDGTLALDTLTLVDAGTKTLAGTISVASGAIDVVSGATLAVNANSHLSGCDVGLVLSGGGSVSNNGTIIVPSLTLALSSAGTDLDNTSHATITANLNSVLSEDMTIRNAGTIDFAASAVSGKVSVENTGRIKGRFTIDKGQTLSVSGGILGDVAETLSVSGEGRMEVRNSATFYGNVAVTGGSLSVSGTMGATVDFTEAVEDFKLESVLVDNGSLQVQAGDLSIYGTDASRKLIEVVNDGRLAANVIIGKETMSGDATILVKNSAISGSLTVLSATAELSNAKVSNVLLLQNQVALDKNNMLAESTAGETELTYGTDYTGTTVVNDVSIGGISGNQLSFVYQASGEYANASYQINDVNVTFDLENAAAIGDSYALYSGAVTFRGSDNRDLDWSELTFTASETNDVYTVTYNEATIATINFSDGTADLYLDFSNTDGITVKRAGTYVWANDVGLSKWTDSLWEKTQVSGGNMTGQAIADDSYVTIASAWAGSLLSLDTDASVSALVFRDSVNFSLNQDGHSFTGNYLNVSSGSVYFHNVGANNFADGAIIADGATLTLASLATGGKLSGSSIQIAGTLNVLCDYSSAETLTIVGTEALINVADSKTAAFDTATGTTATLTKTGTGTLELAASSTLGKVVVSQGTLNFVNDNTSTLGVDLLQMSAGTTVSVSSKVSSTNFDLGENATLALTNTAAQSLRQVSMADGSSLTSSGTLTIDDATRIASTGTATLAATLSQSAGTTSTIDTAAGTLTVDDLTASGTLIKSGDGTLAVTTADLSGTVQIAAGTLNAGTLSTWGTIVATGGSTLEVGGNSSTATSVLGVAPDVTLTVKATSALTFAGNLQSFGTLKFDPRGEAVTLAGTANVYNRIEFNNLTLADGFTAVNAGTLAVNGNGAVLTIAGTTTGDLGSIQVSKNLKIALAATSDASFNDLTGSKNTTLTITGAGTAKFDKINSIMLAISDSATVQLTEGKLSTLSGDTGATLEKIGAGTVLTTETDNSAFAGTVKVSAGTLEFADGGTFSAAELSVAADATAIVNHDAGSFVAIGAVDGSTTIAASLSGAGTLTVGNQNVLSFAAGSADGFTGTLALGNYSTANLNNFSSSATLRLANASAVTIDAGNLTLAKLEYAYNDTALIYLAGANTLAISDFAYSTSTTGNAGTLVFAVEDANGLVTVNADIDNNLNMLAEGAGTLKLAGANYALGDLRVTNTATVDLSAATTAVAVGSATLDGGTIVIGDKVTIGSLASAKTASAIQTAGMMTLTTDIDGFAGTVESLSGKLTLVRAGSMLSPSETVFKADPGASILLDVDADMTQGKASLSGAGTIEIDATDHTLTLSKANDGFTGKLSLVGGTLKLTEAATLGTETVSLLSGTTLVLAPENNKSAVIVAGAVSGSGSISKTGGSKAFIGGNIDISGTITLSSGTLAVTSVESGTKIVFAGAAVLETALNLESGSLVPMSGSTYRTIDAVYTASSSGATFSHESDKGGAVITGSWTTNPVAGAVLTLVNGGEGSTFDLAAGAAQVKKTGMGKWTLSKEFTGSARVMAGTLAVQTFNSTQTVSIDDAGTFEVAGLATSAAGTLTGDFAGSGSLKISTTAKLGDLGSNSGDLLLQVGSGNTLTIVSDLDNSIIVESSATLDFDTSSDFTFGGKLKGDSTATVTKTGAGTLTLGADFGTDLDIALNAGTTVVTNSLGTSSNGTVTIASGATLQVAGTSGTASIGKVIAGTGTLEFVSGTTEISSASDFAGTVQIDSGATLVYSSKNYSATLGDNATLAGSGALRVKYASAARELDWAPASGFTGTLEIETGTVNMTASDLASVAGTINFVASAANNATLKLTTGTSLLNLDNYYTMLNASSAGTLAIDGTAKASGPVGTGALSLRVLSGSTLTLSGALVGGNLTVDNGGTVNVRSGMSTASLTPGSTPALTIAGNLLVSGDYVVSAVPIAVTGDATFTSTANVVLSAIPADSVLMTVAGTTVIDSAATFKLGDGTVLSAALRSGQIFVNQYIASEHAKGLGGFADLIDSDQTSAIWTAVNQSAGDQSAILSAFSPVSFGALSDLSLSVARTENDLLRQRLEQRRYDRAVYNIVSREKTMGYANAIGSSSDTKTSNGGNPHYDLRSYGLQAGVDTLLSQKALAGVNVTYVTGKANLHNSAGKHENDTLSIGLYAQQMLDDYSYLGLGAHFGFSAFDTKRNTVLGVAEGETNGYDFGLSATLGRVFILSDSFHLSPYVGLDLDYMIVNEFEETGSAAIAYNVDSYDRLSVRGVAGTSLTWAPSAQWRFSLDCALRHEFVDNDSDIKATFQGGSYAGAKTKATAYYANETTFSVGPRVEYRFDNSWSLNVGYTYESDFEETTSHGVNVGLRARF